MDPFLVIIGGILFLYWHFVITQYFAYRKLNYFQQTSLAIVIGMIVGLFIYFFTDFYQSQVLNGTLMRDIIFLAFLPPIMFEDGYNFPRRKFFQNIFYINLFGFIGTFVNFAVIFILLTVVNNAGLFCSISDTHQVIQLHNWQIILMSACLCSMQPIVSEKIVNKERHPKLFSIIFGQSLFKDTISLTLFDSTIKIITRFQDQNIEIVGADVGSLILEFIIVVLCSLLIGFATGIITTVIFKNCRFLLVEKGTSEVALTLLTGYLSYIISEWLEFSGVISMLFCGTVLSHFNAYNLTDLGKEATKISIESLKTASSGFIFFFLGFYVFNIQTFQSEADNQFKSAFSGSLLGFTLLALFVGRAFNIFFMSLIGFLILGKNKWRLNRYEYLILYSAGLIKGAVPFALIITIPSNTTVASNCSQTNIISIVFITSVVLSSFLPKFQRLMLREIARIRRQDPTHPSVKDSLLSQFTQDKAIANKKSVDYKDLKLMDKFKSTTQKYWRKFQEGFLKPLLIYDYYQRREQIKLEKLMQRRKEYADYLCRFGGAFNENILDAQNEENNRFIDLKLSNGHSSESSDNQEEERVITKRVQKDTSVRRPSEQQITPMGQLQQVAAPSSNS